MSIYYQGHLTWYHFMKLVYIKVFIFKYSANHIDNCVIFYEFYKTFIVTAME